MRCTVVAIGQRMPAWVQDAFADYAGRLTQGISLELREVPAARRGRNADIAVIREAESMALRAAVPDSHRVVALDERGKAWSTAELARQLDRWMQDGRNVAFLVGGPDGLSEVCLKSADDTWSLSRLTFPHGLVRVILAEQLYRAFSLLRHHPYHRE